MDIKPEFFDIFGIGVFAFIAVVSFWALQTGHPFPRWALIILLMIGVLGLLVDGTIVWITYIQ